MANSSALVVKTLTALCIVLVTGLLCEWMCKMDVATWFLILASEMTIAEDMLDDVLSVVLSSSSMCSLVFEEHGWNVNLSEKESIRQFPGLNSSLKKKRKKWVYYAYCPYQWE